VALLIVLVISAVAAMMGALAIRGAVTELRASGAERSARLGFYCAEAGIEAARGFFAANYPQWSAMFSGTALGGYPVSGDLDGDGVADYQVTLRDDVDEFPPLQNDPLHDSDLVAIMVSRCVNPSMSPRQLEEIVVYNGRGTDYRTQSGHSSAHSGNEN
jgi:hypothetical protein